MPGLVRSGYVYGGTTHKRDWNTKSTGRKYGFFIQFVVERNLNDGCYCIADSVAAGLVYDERLAKRLCLSHRHRLVDIFNCRVVSYFNRLGYSELSNHKSIVGESGEEFKNGVISSMTLNGRRDLYFR